MRYSHLHLSELKNITEHLLTDSELFFTFVYFAVYTSFRIICFEVFQREILFAN